MSIRYFHFVIRRLKIFNVCRLAMWLSLYAQKWWKFHSEEQKSKGGVASDQNDPLQSVNWKSPNEYCDFDKDFTIPWTICYRGCKNQPSIHVSVYSIDSGQTWKVGRAGLVKKSFVNLGQKTLVGPSPLPPTLVFRYKYKGGGESE